MDPTLSWGWGFPSSWPTSTYPSTTIYTHGLYGERHQLIIKISSPIFFVSTFTFRICDCSVCVRLLRLRSRSAPLDRTRRQRLRNTLSARTAPPTDLHRAFVKQALVVDRGEHVWRPQWRKRALRTVDRQIPS